MQKLNPNWTYKSKEQSSSDSLMGSKQQLIDSLTAHISLYHSKSSPSSSPTNPNPNPRSSILKWFSSLTGYQRQAYLTIVDKSFVQILLQMQHKLRSNGHGFFIIIPDIPSPDSSCLPSLCYRRSKGLLARVSESNELERLIYESIRLFSSKEGEGADECSCYLNCLDSMTVSEDIVENEDRFVAAMDEVSNGGFLMGEEGGLGTEWVELEWLKGKGYYGIEAFVANRLEVTLRLSWLNCNNNWKKRGVKLKEKAYAAGVAANVFWRKKGCADWWACLDDATKRKVLQTILGKAAKSLTAEIIKGTNGPLEDEMWLVNANAKQPMRCYISLHHRIFMPPRGIDAEFGFNETLASASGKDSSLVNKLRGLLVLRDISTVLLGCSGSKYDTDKLFFSLLGSVNTISDCILRKLRGLLMVVSLDCTKLELLEEGNSVLSSKKSKEKPGASSRKKKGKSCNLKRPNFVSTSSNDGPPFDNAAKEHGEGLVNGNCQRASQKSRKGGKKSRKSGLCGPVEVGSCQTRATIDRSVSFVSQSEATKSRSVSKILGVENMLNDALIGKDELMTNPASCASEPIRMDSLAQIIEGDYVTDFTKNSCDSGPKLWQSSDRDIENGAGGAELETYEVNSDKIPPVMRAVEISDVLSNESNNCGHLNQIDRKAIFSEKQIKYIYPEEESIPAQDGESIGVYDSRAINSSEFLSYEWPSLAPIHFPSVNSHLPAATDRLHLDVGYNWQNHFHQTFVQTVHQVRNPPIENGCNGIVSQPLPMSLDWPLMVRSVSGFAPTVTCNYDAGFISRQQSSFQQGFTGQSVQLSTMATEDEKLHPANFMELSDLTNSQELADENDNHWVSEEEFEVHAVSGMDYNQYFGGGVMYWNPSDHPATSFSRPPSLSSDDSSWAWREADINRSVDDVVAFSSSYSTNGLTSPSTASFCSPFDSLGPGHQALGYVIPGSEVNGKVLHSPSAMTDIVGDENVSGPLSNFPGDGEAKTGDSLPYPILRPIIIPNMSREGSRSDFKCSHEHKSPCVPPNGREQPRIKRPPSPVVLCVPRAPHPPPPSPVGDFRKQRGFPTVRSGSSSPRHWGMRGCWPDGINYEEACVRMDGSEVVWPSWRNKSLSACQLTQPLPEALLQDRLIAISHLARDQEHPDVAFPLQPPDLLNCPMHKASLSLMHNLLHDEIDSFCKQVASEYLIRKPYINWAVKRVTRSLQVLWPRSRTNIFGSNATGLSLPTSDVDLVVCLPPVRNLEPIKEAGILEGRNGIKETCLQHAARYLANQEWVKNDSLKIVENTAIPIIMLVVEVPCDVIPSATSKLQTLKEKAIHVTGEQGSSFQTDMVGLESSALPKCSDICKDTKSIRLDISFKSPSHTGLQTTKLVKELTEQFPAATPLALVLKQFLADRSLDQSYSGGLSSYCLVLLITRFLQHEHHHGRPINQNFGSLLMDFLYFFGNVFDPRQMCISVRGSGIYLTRERSYSIDPIYIDDPLFPTNNVGRNCFRIHQCIKAFSDAYSTLENELSFLPNNGDSSTSPPCKLLPKIIPSIGLS